jgi:hypothetical protein
MTSDGTILAVAAWRVHGNLLLMEVPGVPGAKRGDFTYIVMPASPDRLFLTHVGSGTKFILMKK